jgi:putative solute:sodium symporter small subunit
MTDFSPDSTQAARGDSSEVPKDPEIRASLNRYWRSNVRLTLVLLGIWAFSGLFLGVLVADKLNEHNLPGTGYPLGFWFAQQGSIIIFVLLILVYCILMNRFDDDHHKDLERIQKGGES